MVRKIILWACYLGFVGILVYGAMYRVRATGSKTDNGASNANYAQTESLDQQNETSEPKYDLLILSGRTVLFDDHMMVIKMEDGRDVEITRRAFRYALENSFRSSTGEQLSITGFYENGEFEVAKIINLDNGEILTLRDENGKPIWSGNR